MDLDPCSSSSSTDMSLSMNMPGLGLPKIDEDNIMDPQAAKQKMTEMLDLLESRVEKLRKEASTLEEDRDHILATLDSIRTADWITDMVHFEQEETHRYLDRIVERCLTVDIKIHTQRDKPQEEALHQVNHLIDALVMSLKSDPEGAKEKCVAYMNACSSHNVHGVSDKKFENALLGCTLDDQKRVKKRLQGLLSYFDKLGLICEDVSSAFDYIGLEYREEFQVLKRKVDLAFDEEFSDSLEDNEIIKKLKTTNGMFLCNLWDRMRTLPKGKQMEFKTETLNNLTSEKYRF